MLSQALDVFLKGTHLLLVAKNLDYIASCNYSQLWEESLYHLQMDIVDTIENHWVNVLQNYMLLSQFYLNV